MLYKLTGQVIHIGEIRAGFQANVKPQLFCTKESTTNFCRIPGQYGFKWPTLTELHTKLFGEEFSGAHDALNDVDACAKCFFELQRIGVIKVKHQLVVSVPA